MTLNNYLIKIHNLKKTFEMYLFHILLYLLNEIN